MGRKIFGNAGFMRVSDPRKLFWGSGIWDAGMTAFDGFGFWGLFLGKKKGCRNDKKEL